MDRPPCARLPAGERPSRVSRHTVHDPAASCEKGTPSHARTRQSRPETGRSATAAVHDDASRTERHRLPFLEGKPRTREPRRRASARGVGRPVSAGSQATTASVAGGRPSYRGRSRHRLSPHRRTTGSLLQITRLPGNPQSCDARGSPRARVGAAPDSPPSSHGCRRAIPRLRSARSFQNTGRHSVSGYGLMTRCLIRQPSAVLTKMSS